MMHKDQKNYLDLLTVVTPDAGWKVEEAFLATYSLDLQALGMMLMAMAGTWRQDGTDPKRTDAVKAIDSMRGKVHVVVNPTRVKATGKSLPKIIHILDQFYHEYKSDLSDDHSWHPKIILIKFVANERHTRKRKTKTPARMWRLWVGSKNFTFANNLDLGIVMEGEPGPGKTNLEGVVTAAQQIARGAKRPATEQDRIRKELERVKWKLPIGVTRNSEIELLLPSDKTRTYPILPSDAMELILVSPFLDVKTLKYFAELQANAPTKRKLRQRRLISTKGELERLERETNDCLRGFEIYSLPNAVLTGATTSDSDEVNETANDGLDAESRDEVVDEYAVGLHAKFLLVRTPDSHLLWLGSANATNRGWKKNVEVMGKFSISKSLYQRLKQEICDNADLYMVDDTTQEDEENNELNKSTEIVENARKQMEKRFRMQSLVLNEENNELILSTPFQIDEFTDHSDLIVKCGLSTFDSRDLVEWICHEDDRLSLGPCSAIEKHQLTANVTIQLTCGDTTSSFITKAYYKDLDYLDRDRAAYEKYLPPETFLELVFWELSGTRRGPGGGAWDGPRDFGSDRSENRGITFAVENLPTVDMILKAWSADQTVLDRVKYQIEFARKIFETDNSKTSNTEPINGDKECSQRQEKDRARLLKFVEMFHQIEKGLRTRSR